MRMVILVLFFFVTLTLAQSKGHGHVSLLVSKSGLEFARDYLINEVISTTIPLKLPDIEKKVKIPLVGNVRIGLSNVQIIAVHVQSSKIETGVKGVVLSVSGATGDLSMDWSYTYKASFFQINDHGDASVKELLVAGTDTSTHAIQWTIAELINNPNILERLREEIDFVVGKSRLIQEMDLPNIPFLQAVVKEGLRLHPPATFLVRAFQESCEIKDFYIPEKTRLLVNIYDVMRDPNTWDDPEEFKPERFLVTSEDEIRAEVLKYIPFGSGRRGCPGSNLSYLSIGVAIGVMVQCFDWEFIGDKVNMEEVGGAITLTMAHPLKCTLIPRTLNPLA